jgi:hypothetical protein
MSRMSVQRLGNLPAIQITHQVTDVLPEDVEQVTGHCQQLYEQVQGPIYLIHDIRLVNLDFAHLVRLLPLIPTQPQPLTALPLTIYDVMEVDNAVVWIGVKALQAGKYGQMNIRVVQTVENALEAIRRQLRAAAPPIG